MRSNTLAIALAIVVLLAGAVEISVFGVHRRGQFGTSPHFVYPALSPTPTEMPAPLLAARLTVYTLPHAHMPCSIVVRQDYTLWFTECTDNAVGRITQGGVVTEFRLSVPVAPLFIAAGPGSVLWFGGAQRVGRITADGHITVFPPLPAGTMLGGLAVGPDGSAWFTDTGTNAVDSISAAGTIRRFPLRLQSDLAGITAGRDGSLWFALPIGDTLGRITPAGSTTFYGVAGSADVMFPSAVTRGPDEALWFAATGGIGRMGLDGTLSLFPLPGGRYGEETNDIVSGPDGDLWFLLEGGARLGRYTPGGTTTIYALPAAAGALNGIAAGPDGALWAATETGQILMLPIPPSARTEHLPTSALPAAQPTG